MKSYIIVLVLFFQSSLIAMNGITRQFQVLRSSLIFQQLRQCSSASTSNASNNACRCYTPEIINRGAFVENYADLWKELHEKAIRHKISKEIDLSEIERKEWVAISQEGKDWNDYTKSAVISFAADKDLVVRTICGKIYQSKEGTEARLGVLLKDSRRKSMMVANTDRLSFISKKLANTECFSMAIAIEDRPIGIINKDEYSWSDKNMKILKQAAECLYHWELGIPWYIALKKIDKDNPVTQLQNHQKLDWVSLSANGLNLLTKTEKGDCYLWSIEHLVSEPMKKK